MARRSFDISVVMTLLVGALLLLDGVAGLLYSQSFVGELGRALGSQSAAVRLIVAIVEVVAGALLVLSIIVDLGQLGQALGLAIFLVWVAVMVIRFVINDFQPDTLNWWIDVIQYGIVLAVIWQVRTPRR